MKTYETIRIPLGNGLVALISWDDEELVSMNWSAHKDNKTNTYYACYRYSIGDSRFRRWLHNEVMENILGRELKAGEIVDHINGDKLDCRRENLRIATRSQNEMNKKKGRGVSKYKGVVYEKNRSKWRARIYINKQRKNIGYFNTEEEAALAYNKAAKEAYGEFAILNEVKNNVK